ncbi:Hsp70 family protein [Dactylosporangium sp. NPDC005555]|uniref:Hsp70 family protein n=1 Tax=Dactylosporangium sp. NPDC005555 TaxID=3154889 RepID=UPI0033B82980
MHLAIDLGTACTVAVLGDAGGRTVPLLFDGSPLLPSAVHLDVAAGVLAVGGDAVRGGTTDPDRLEPHPKLRAAEKSVVLGGTDVPVEHLLAAVLWAVHAEALKLTGGTPLLEVALTHPASWGTHQRGALLTAASMAGLPAARLVPSPVAVAAALTGQVRTSSERCLVVYELGAATCEVAVVLPGTGVPRIVAAAGLAGAGGLAVDTAIAGHLIAATPGGEHLSVADRRRVLDQARHAKEILSAGTPAVIRVAGRGDVHLTPADLERIATPVLRPTAELALRMIRAADVEVAGVYLAGGASLMPLVGTLLHRVAGIVPVAAAHPKLAAAEGALTILTATHAGPGVAAAAGPGPDPAGSGPGPDSAADLGAQLAAGPQDGAAAPHPQAVAARPVAVHAGQVAAVPVMVQEPAGGDGAHLWDWMPAPGTLVPGSVWRDAPFQPVLIGLPSGSGWTVRARFVEPDETVFLSRGGGPLLFRSVEGLCEYLMDDGGHELAGLDGWPRVRAQFVGLVSCLGDPLGDPLGGPLDDPLDDEEEVDLDLVLYNLEFRPRQWKPDLLVAARDLVVELADAYELTDLAAHLAPGGLLDVVDELLRHADRTLAGRSARRGLDALDPGPVRWTWHTIVARLDSIAAWAD